MDRSVDDRVKISSNKFIYGTHQNLVRQAAKAAAAKTNEAVNLSNMANEREMVTRSVSKADVLSLAYAAGFH